MNLTQATSELVYQAIADALAIHRTDQLTGISCLAAGADSIFARAVLDHGGQLEVILPAADYRQTRVKPDHAAEFDELMGKATSILTMPFDKANRAAYEAANEAMISACDELLAVWDGQVGVDRGGTASAVAEARERGLPVVVIWPAEAQRS